MEQLTDQQMLERANTIKTETETGANTAFRIGTILENLVVNKPNITTLSNVNNTSDAQKVASGPIKDALDNKYDASNPSNFITFAEASGSAPIQTVAGKTGNVTLNKSDVGLAFVDNTSDLNKPVSTATQSALDLKVNIEVGKSLTTNDFTNIDKSKLDAIEAGAQVNTVVPSDLLDFETTAELNTRDTNNRSRANHTGTQAIATITSLQTTLDAKELLSNKVTTLTSANNTTYPTSAAVATAIADIAAGESYQGSWNASTNTPTLVSSSGTDGHYYQVTVSGSTNLDGETNWQLGDEAIFKGGVWLRRENFAVTSWAGKTGVVLPEISDITNLQTALNDKLEASDLANYETSTQLNSRDTANRNRSNHTGSQTASTISDFNSAVSNNSAVSANTLKRSYPLVDQNKLSGIEAGAEVNDTAAEIKTKYESNLNTNAYTDAEKSKLSGIEAGAEVNEVSSLDIADFETTTQLNSRDTANRNTDNHVNGTNNKVFTAAEQTKLSGVAANANNYSHPNHTGDVTSDGDGLQTIASGVVSNDKLANMAANTLKIRIGTAGSPQDGTIAQTKTLLALENVDNTSDANKPISTATQNALNTKLESADVANFETSTELNARDTANRSRVNHTGSQLASTISDFQTQVSANSNVIANTAKRSYPSGDETKLAGIETGAEVNDTGVEIITKIEGVDPANYLDLQYTQGGSVLNNTQFEGAGTVGDPISISKDLTPTQNSTKFISSGDLWQYEQNNPRGKDYWTLENVRQALFVSGEDMNTNGAKLVVTPTSVIITGDGSSANGRNGMISFDGVTFKRINTGYFITTGLEYSNGTTIMCGRNTGAGSYMCKRSTNDGRTWNDITLPVNSLPIDIATDGEGNWVIACRTTGVGYPNVIHSSDDGLTWNVGTVIDETLEFYEVVCAGGNFLLIAFVGTDRYQLSTNKGTSFTTVTPTNNTGHFPHSAVVHKGRIIITSNGSSPASHNRLLISEDNGVTLVGVSNGFDDISIRESGTAGDYVYTSSEIGSRLFRSKTGLAGTWEEVTTSTVNEILYIGGGMFNSLPYTAFGTSAVTEKILINI